MHQRRVCACVHEPTRVRSGACARRRRIGAEPYRAAGTSRWARRRSRKKIQQPLLETARRAEERPNFSVHGKNRTPEPALLLPSHTNRRFGRLLVFILFYFIFFLHLFLSTTSLLSLFLHLSIWGAHAAGRETKDPRGLTEGEKKKKKKK